MKVVPMLDRETLANGNFSQAFKDVPGIDLWSDERIEASMQQTLAQRPANEPVWLFAYGSLIWNPLFEFAESCVATLEGWRRSFCIRLLIGRASPAQPGRMMSLVRGSSIAGLALRLSEENLEHELRIVWRREMIGGAYCPEWAPVTLQDGRTVQAIIFRANPDSRMHEADDNIETIAPMIAAAQGPLGTNRDYVEKLDHALQSYGIQDDYIRELVQKLD